MKKYLLLNKDILNQRGVKTYKELWETNQKDFTGLLIGTKIEFKKIGDANSAKYHCIFSTPEEDRHLDKVFQNFELENFKNNPVFIDSHDYSSITKILGKIENIEVKDGMLQGDVVFNLDSPLGLLARNMVENGFLNATSIGFIPKLFDDEGNIIKSELLEVSGVAVPAHQDALFIKTIEIEEGDDTPPEVIEDELEDVIDENDNIPINSKKTLYNAISTLKKEHTSVIIRIAQGLEIKNEHKKKRMIFKTIRDSLK